MFTCQGCGKEFEVRQEILDRYPGWSPSRCLDCRANAEGSGDRSAAAAGRQAPSASARRDMTVGEVLAAFKEGPTTGLFTDGSSEGNPGPGGWGAVLVVDDRIVGEDYGSDAHTTNNRMELMALIAGLKMVPPDSKVTVYCDSQLVVNIVTEWAAGWEARGWRKKSSGPIANLELVKEAHALAQRRPLADIRWIKAHSGYRWNEYADALATAYRREEM